MADVLQQVSELRATAERVQARRAQAEAGLALALQQLDQTEQELRSLGVDPDHAEQELRVLEDQLLAATKSLGDQLQVELAACEEVIRVTAEALK